jgi:hypothetical protein
MVEKLILHPKKKNLKKNYVNGNGTRPDLIANNTSILLNKIKT